VLPTVFSRPYVFVLAEMHLHDSCPFLLHPNETVVHHLISWQVKSGSMRLMILKVSLFCFECFVFIFVPVSSADTSPIAPGMLWLLVDVAEWHSFSDLPDDPKRCESIILSRRRDFLTADVSGRHRVSCSLLKSPPLFAA
jgi:hypothetical protein